MTVFRPNSGWKSWVFFCKNHFFSFSEEIIKMINYWVIHRFRIKSNLLPWIRNKKLTKLSVCRAVSCHSIVKINDARWWWWWRANSYRSNFLRKRQIWIKTIGFIVKLMTLNDDGGGQTVTGLNFWEYAKSNKNTSENPSL